MKKRIKKKVAEFNSESFEEFLIRTHTHLVGAQGVDGSKYEITGELCSHCGNGGFIRRKDICPNTTQYHGNEYNPFKRDNKGGGSHGR